LVFGWASVAKDADGNDLEDLQGDVIELDELEKAAYDFMLYSRNVDEMHDGPVKGQLVESFMVTPDKLAKMGLKNESAPQVALWIGAKLDPATFAKVQAGTYTMFSIEGRAERVEV
jgi:hypothetical protein